jgi:hypothetical protein
VTDFDELSVYGIELRRKIIFRGHVNLGLPRHWNHKFLGFVELLMFAGIGGLLNRKWGCPAKALGASSNGLSCSSPDTTLISRDSGQGTRICVDGLHGDDTAKMKCGPCAMPRKSKEIRPILRIREALEHCGIDCCISWCGPGEHVEMTVGRFGVAGKGKAIRLRAIPHGGRGTVIDSSKRARGKPGSSGYKSSPETLQVFLSLSPLLTLNHQTV